MLENNYKLATCKQCLIDQTSILTVHLHRKIGNLEITLDLRLHCILFIGSMTRFCNHCRKIFHQKLSFLDIDGNANSIVGSDNNSNEALTIITAGHYDIHLVGVSSTVWWVSGFVSSDTVPTFAD